MSETYAFRCASCNSLAASGHAGERDVPAKCSTCGVDDNWVVLADLDDKALDAVLRYHALTPNDIERHRPGPATSAPWGSWRSPANLSASVAEGVGASNDQNGAKP